MTRVEELNKRLIGLHELSYGTFSEYVVAVLLEDIAISLATIADVLTEEKPNGRTD